jgi:Flp pilus assembly protein TadG
MSALRSFFKDESGEAVIEFVLVFPMVFTLFTASVESSVYMMKYVMFERSVDIVVRNLRLAVYGDNITHEDLKKSICRNGMLFSSLASCTNAMKIWMQPINTGNFAMGSTSAPCVDKANEINTGAPAGSEYALGGDNEVMLIRVCIKEWPMFPTTAISVKMPTQSDGSVTMIVSSTFVNEPA